MPDEEGSTLLADVIYQKQSKWNVYQEETYRLSKRLCGITSICFVLQKKVHIKGFSFQKPDRAFQLNNAAECDRIYGDMYTLKEDRVEGIGNNVSLEFEQMDFTGEGAVHIRFSSHEGETNQLVEFTQTDGYVERVFGLEPITGMQKVTFIFLPGSNFDFGWFRFEN